MAGPRTATRLVRLGDSSLTLADPAEDIRGRTARDRNGDELGEVSDLFVDETHRKVRLVEVATGGFLGMGRTTSLFPVDVVTGLSGDEVRMDTTREHATGAPEYDPALALDDDYVAGLYGYYGHDPYWGPGYRATGYPYF